jgi:catechol 2,3-dioxygenase-like lactoylglutathione lyase family enzyme
MDVVDHGAIIASMPRVTGLDHIVLLVEDVERSVAWYVDVLGLQAERLDEWRDGKVFFPSVRVSPTTVIDILAGGAGDPRGDASREQKNVDHFCLVVADDVAELARSGRFNVVDGPDRRWGAQGDATSIYVTDPDGNVVELRAY